MAIRIAVANQKGGCGKTATCHALGNILAREHNRRVLLVDMDPQASLTEACGLDLGDGLPSVAEVIGGAKPSKVKLGRVIVRPPEWPETLEIAPASIELAVCELGLAGRLLGRETVLRQSLDTVDSDYDFVLVDCSPSLGLLVLNALMAVDFVIVPTQAKVQDLRGLRLFLDTLGQVKASNTRLSERVLVTMYRGFNANKRSLCALSDAHLPMFATTIGDSIRVAEGPEYRQTITDYAPGNPRAAEYRALACEVLAWVSQN